jgi:hypothetical protein
MALAGLLEAGRSALQEEAVRFALATLAMRTLDPKDKAHRETVSERDLPRPKRDVPGSACGYSFRETLSRLRFHMLCHRSGSTASFWWPRTST